MRVWRILSRALLPLAVRHLAAHRRAAGVAGIAMACGVASIVATQLVYESVVASYESTTFRFAGRAALQVTNGEGGVPEEIADELRRVPGVRAVAASVEGFVAVPDLPGERLYLYGIDLLADQQVRDYGPTSTAVVSDPLVFLAAPDSVALSRSFMRAHALALNDRLRVLAPAGVVELTIRAALGAEQGPASAFDGRVAVVDLSVAQDALRIERRVSQLAIDVAPTADLDRVARAVERQVGGRGVVERPTDRAAAFARLLRNYRYGLLLAATTSMVVALYFVFNVATIAVVERRRELGLLRAVGMRAGGIVALVVVELLALSAVASVAGLPLGLGLARLLAGTVGDTVAALYADVGLPVPALHWGLVPLAVGLGMLTPLVAAVGPIMQVLRLQPLEVLRPSTTVAPRCATFVGAALSGLGILAAASGAWLGRALLPFSIEVVGMVAMLGAVVGMALIVPLAIRLLAERIEHGTRRRVGPLAMLASRNVTDEIGPVAITGSAVLVSLAGTIAIATWLTSLDATLNAAFDAVFGGIDLVVSSGADPFRHDATRIPASVIDEVAALPGVAHVDPVRIATLGFDGSMAAVVASDAGSYLDGRRALYMIDGDPAAAAAALASGTAVVVNGAFATRFGRRRGEMLQLTTPEGPLALRIAGIYLELAPGDLGTIHLDRALYRRWWRDDTASVLALVLQRGGDRQRVSDAVRAGWGERHGLVVLTLEQLRREYRTMLMRLTRLVYPLLASAAVIALVGIVSARAASMLARARVSAALRAIGVTRRQLGQVFAIEAALVGGVGAVLAALVGSVLGRIQVDVLMRGMLGMSVLYSYPRALALCGGVGVVALTGAAGWVLGRRAADMAVDQAKGWE